jgi:hypothetical protein
MIDKFKKKRVQFNDFRLLHFEITPVWKFVHGEDDPYEVDETTLRPWFDSGSPDPRDGMFIVKAIFSTSGGKQYPGLVTPAHSFDYGEIQPHVFTEIGLLPLWLGGVLVNKKKLASFYPKINETKDSFFPLIFKSEVECKGVRLEGKVEGFMNSKNKKVIVTR